MTYDEALTYIHDVNWRGSRRGLSRTRELLKRMGDPQKKLKFIHVAGTNGKGSTSRMLACILEKAGYRTGLYTSPFIERFNERMQVNGESIADDALARITEFVKPFADGMQDHPTEFEIVTAIGFQWFLEQHCDIVVLEVGLGGELDSTNVIDSPLAAVIVAMGFDHMKELGNTMGEIASAKAGIIKPGTVCISYGGVPEADEVILNKAAALNVPVVSPDFDQLKVVSQTIHETIFSYKERKDLRIHLAGSYQPRNAAVVLETVDVIRERGFTIPEEAVRDGLDSAAWLARFEIVLEKPLFIIDGGHNPHGVRATAETIKALFPGEKLTFVSGFMADKDIDGIIEILKPFIDHVYCVRPDNPRAIDPEALRDKFLRTGISASAEPNIRSGVRDALKEAGQDGKVIGCGSLYLAGDLERLIREYKQNGVL